MTVRELERIFQIEIEEKSIDEFTNPYLHNIANKYECNPFELGDFFINEKGFKTIKHNAGFNIYQRHDLNLNELFEAIDSYCHNFRVRNGKTLFEIVENYNELELNDNSYSFSASSIIKKLNQLKIEKMR